MTTAGEMVQMISKSIVEGFFGNSEKGPWPEDPDGGELRIANTLMSILRECEELRKDGIEVIPVTHMVRIAERILVHGDIVRRNERFS